MRGGRKKRADKESRSSVGGGMGAGMGVPRGWGGGALGEFFIKSSLTKYKMLTRLS